MKKIEEREWASEKGEEGGGGKREREIEDSDVLCILRRACTYLT